jgi:hypothetical protein
MLCSLSLAGGPQNHQPTFRLERNLTYIHHPHGHSDALVLTGLKKLSQIAHHYLHLVFSSQTVNPWTSTPCIYLSSAQTAKRKCVLSPKNAPVNSGMLQLPSST